MMANRMLRLDMLIVLYIHAVLLCVSSTFATTVIAFRGETAVLPCDAFLHIRSKVNPSSVIVTWNEMDPSQQLVNSTYPHNGRYMLITESNNSLLVQDVDPRTDNRTFRCMAQGIANQEESLATTSEGMTVAITQATLTTSEFYIETNATITSNVSEVILITTEPDRPGQPRATEIGSETLVLSWSPSNGPVANYTVSVSRGNETFRWMPAFTQPKNASSSYTVLGLLSFDFYFFQVRAYFTTGYYKDGVASDLIMTAPGRPLLPPLNVTVSSRGPTTIAVSWQPPSPNSINGILHGYRVMVSPGSEVIPFGPTTLSTVITERMPYTMYTVSVVVVNNAAETEKQGPYSPTVSVTTDEAAPGPPHNLQLVGQTIDTLIVFWRRPDMENGQILFYYVYIRKRGDYDWKRFRVVDRQQHYVFNELDIFTDYEIKASASTRAGEGRNSTTLYTTTDVAAPSEPRNVSIQIIAPGVAYVSWIEPLTFYNTIDSYTISYHQINVTSSTLTTVETNMSRILRGLKNETYYELTVRASTRSIVPNMGTILMGDSSIPETFLVSYIPSMLGLYTEPWATHSPPGDSFDPETFLVSYTPSMPGPDPGSWATRSPPGDARTIIGVVCALLIPLVLTVDNIWQ